MSEMKRYKSYKKIAGKAKGGRPKKYGEEKIRHVKCPIRLISEVEQFIYARLKDGVRVRGKKGVDKAKDGNRRTPQAKKADRGEAR